MTILVVEGRNFGFGEPLSEAVRAAVAPAVGAVESVLADFAINAQQALERPQR